MGGCLSQFLPTSTAVPQPEPEQLVLRKRSSQAENPRNSKFIDRLVTAESPRLAPPRYINAAYWPQWIAYHERYPSLVCGFAKATHCHRDMRSMPIRLLRQKLISNEKFDVSKLTHVFYAFASINPEGTLRCTDEIIDLQLPVDTDGTTGCINAWTKLKAQNPHLKVILSVGGEGASSARYAWVGSQAQSRENFATSATHLLQLYNLDGIDLNWDPASAEEGRQLLELVRTVRKSFKSTKYMITACLPGTERLLRRIAPILGSLGRELDLVNLMAYDFVDSHSAETGHHAQLSAGRDRPKADTDQSCEIAVDYLKTHGVSARKILLGVPLFGRSFLGATGPGQKFTTAGGINGVHEVRNLPRPGAEEVYDEILGAAWCGSSQANEFVSYDNEESLFDKAWYVKDAGLAGLFYWHMGYDRMGERSLIRKGWDTLEAKGGHS